MKLSSISTFISSFLMPATRKPPTQAAAHRRNPKPEDVNMRTRSGGRGKNAPVKPEKGELAVNGNNELSPTLSRKNTRSSSNISTYSLIAVGGVPPPVKATLINRRVINISNLPRDFLMKLKEEDEKNEKAQADSRANAALYRPNEDDSESDHLSLSPDPIPVRRSRGGRGSRARGGRGRGRGGIRKEAFPEKRVEISPKKVRPTRTAAPAFPLTEVEDESPSNHESPYESAKESNPHHHEKVAVDNANGNAHQSDHTTQNAGNDHFVPVQDAHFTSTTPNVSPPPGLQTPDSSTSPLNTAPTQNATQPSFSQEQNALASQEQSAVATPVDDEAQKIPMLNPEDDMLSDFDLLPPFITDASKPPREECEDEADYLLKQRYDPVNDPAAFVAALTKYPPSARSNEVLWTLALNAQKTLMAWQNEFLELDARTAPHQHPPKKPATGGRVPIPTPVFEDMKEADLYSYVFDSRKPPGFQDPHAQRLGRDNIGGRELRQRRGRDLLGSAAATEDEGEDAEGRASRRKRRAVQRFDMTEPNSGSNTPRRNGWGGARKRGVSAIAPAASETPEPDSRAKRAKTAAHALLPHRIQEMREESTVPSSGDEAKADASKRRGRPPGSKNLQKRSDAGIKKGPRKGTNGAAAAAAAQVPKPAPVTLESLSQGQNQFSIEPRLTAPVPQHRSLTPNMAVPVATVFQAAPQPAVAPPNNLAPTTSIIKAPAQDSFITTTPLSQYGAHPFDESSQSGPAGEKKRKQRVKSEKRSQSMTIWWAERKARAAEQKAAQRALQTDDQGNAQNRALVGVSPNDSPAPSSPASLGNSRATSRAPPSTYMPLNNGLAALPSNPPMNPSARPLMPALAPAPPPHQQHHHHHHHQFHSPYPTPGPRTVIPRPKSNSGPAPLAPAPHPTHSRQGSGHISPYPPVGPAMGHQGQHQHVLGPVGPVGMGVQGAIHPYQGGPHQ
ncbi:hypothetical protein GQ43DRAFT_465296 [Delitschia confertaspora ATCC 74209]|uniref:Uncharacterized protein n=1 Tax=Delitschia confertaspora ATCC 74209 TaxID=1513339 RepID=A0A9P4JLV7_9PLEO|nr:hypothetical protein GQ43DRAFT_465296 [Delitschia confertaspora ATCC 74209]